MERKISDYTSNRFNGLENRLYQIVNPESERTVMLAVDHGYFQGAPEGLINLRQTIEPLLPYCDAFSPTIGGLKTSVPVNTRVPIILRATGGNSMTRKEELDDETITVSIEEILRNNAIGFTASCFIGMPHQKQTIKNLTDLANEGHKYGLIAIGITAVGGKYDKIVKGEKEGGEELTEEDKKGALRYLKHACRVLSENGADIVKSYYCDSFEEIVESCLAPIVVAGGTLRPTPEALEYVYKSIQAGAIGVDMGRNIFQNENPVAMINAIREIVHKNATAEEAYEFYNTYDIRKTGSLD